MFLNRGCVDVKLGPWERMTDDRNGATSKSTLKKPNLVC